VPNELQIGQTGKVVAPALYVAVRLHTSVSLLSIFFYHIVLGLSGNFLFAILSFRLSSAHNLPARRCYISCSHVLLIATSFSMIVGWHQWSNSTLVWHEG
jgi:hypothetical protein